MYFRGFPFFVTFLGGFRVNKHQTLFLNQEILRYRNPHHLVHLKCSLLSAKDCVPLSGLVRIRTDVHIKGRYPRDGRLIFVQQFSQGLLR